MCVSLRTRCTGQSRDEDGLGALHWAARGGYCDICILLIKHGAEINTTQGMTPLFWAAVNGKKAVCKILIKQGVNLSSKGSTAALCWALANDQIETSKLLIKSGIAISDANSIPLFKLAKKGQLELCKLHMKQLIFRGSKQNSKKRIYLLLLCFKKMKERLETIRSIFREACKPYPLLRIAALPPFFAEDYLRDLAPSIEKQLGLPDNQSKALLKLR